MSTILDAEVIDSDTDTEDANGEEQTSLPNLSCYFRQEFRVPKTKIKTYRGQTIEWALL